MYVGLGTLTMRTGGLHVMSWLVHPRFFRPTVRVVASALEGLSGIFTGLLLGLSARG